MVSVVGFGAIAAASLYFVFRKKPENADAIERQRRAYLNRIGRIAEGQVVEVSGQSAVSSPAGVAAATAIVGVAPKMLYYSYSISGVTYETAQDVTGLEEQAHLNRVVAGQHASVKYDPSNPSNSILLADDWCGLH
jgi:xanthine dehydrogenase iron-sulfur cluster and FAD-binding subunit A